MLSPKRDAQFLELPAEVDHVGRYVAPVRRQQRPVGGLDRQHVVHAARVARRVLGQLGEALVDAADVPHDIGEAFDAGRGGERGPHEAIEVGPGVACGGGYLRGDQSVEALAHRHRSDAHLTGTAECLGEGDALPLGEGLHARLRAIAWALLGLQILNLIASSMGGIDVDVSIAGWIAVLLLFVLAQVFEEGARMRADLEGTI